jgi:hypothetical protein
MLPIIPCPKRRKAGRPRVNKKKPPPTVTVVFQGGESIGFDTIELTRFAVVGIRNGSRSIIATRSPDGRFLADDLTTHDVVTVGPTPKVATASEPRRHEGRHND